MNPLAILTEAWISLSVTRMRSFLTMLGVIIGVAAVVLMLSIGDGVRGKINESISSMGSNLFIVLSGASTSGGIRMGLGSSPTLTTNDANELASLPDIAAVAPIMPGQVQIVAGNSNWNTTVAGVTPEFLGVREWQIFQGENITDAHVRGGARVAVIGSTVARNLFEQEEMALGATIRIKNIPFEVIGLLQNKGQSLDGRDQDDTVLIPLTTAQRKLFGSQFPNSVRLMLVKAKTKESMESLGEEMRKTLRRLHRLGTQADDDFTIRDLTAVAATAESVGRSMSLMLGAVASISLLVGGVGIMNIMLVAVTERTREIGLRKAIGAYERDILGQFMTEAVLLSLGGGIIGIALGFISSRIIGNIIMMHLPISATSLFISFFIATAVGVFFGYYPARKAAKMRPIEALRQ